MIDLLLLSLVPVVTALIIGCGVASYIRRSIPIEPVATRIPDTLEPPPLPHGHAAPDASGANRVGPDEER